MFKRFWFCYQDVRNTGFLVEVLRPQALFWQEKRWWWLQFIGHTRGSRV